MGNRGYKSGREHPRSKPFNDHFILGDVVVILLTQGVWTYIDIEDLPVVSQHRWYADKIGKTYYAKTEFRDSENRRRTLRLHNLLLPPKPGMETDHVSRNGIDNVRSNLRHVTRSQNSQNHTLHKDNTSGYPGVWFRKDIGKWAACAKGEGGTVHLGTYSSIEEAVEARVRYVREHYLADSWQK